MLQFLQTHNWKLDCWVIKRLILRFHFWPLCRRVSSSVLSVGESGEIQIYVQNDADGGTEQLCKNDTSKHNRSKDSSFHAGTLCCLFEKKKKQQTFRCIFSVIEMMLI